MRIDVKRREIWEWSDHTHKQEHFVSLETESPRP
jgi:hypothetical protein